MSTTDAWREKAIEASPKQAQMVDQVTEEAPFMAAMPVQASSHDLSNVYEEVLEITEADTVDFDEALPSVDAKTELKQKDLTKIGGIMRVGKDKANLMGGPQRYFAGKTPMILRKTGNGIETSLLYNSFRAFAFAQGKLVDAGATANAYSILCIKWTPGEMYGLFSPSFFGNGKVFEMNAVNGGNSYELPAASGGMIGYGMTLETVLGTQLANSRYISGIVNADLTTNLPTEAEMSNMVLDARANPANSIIVMHPRLKTALGKAYKLSHLQVFNNDRQVNTIIDAWDDIPILTTYNLKDGTESQVVI
jgi:hypothetical protein